MNKPRARKRDDRKPAEPANSEVKHSTMPLEEIWAKFGKPGTIPGGEATRSFGQKGNWWG